ncbi:MAG: TSUP family transporter [Candidatus Latescibacteria bacterium]|nr:TSUP family transporter [Candidatus Latescibacterota bacterium]
MGFDGTTLVLINVIVCGAAFVSALSGFGYGLVGTPFLMIFFPPQLVVPLVLLSWSPLGVVLAWEARRQMVMRQIGLWLLGGLPTIFLGTYILIHVPARPLSWAIGCFTVGVALLMGFTPSRPFKRENWGCIGAGLISGTTGGACGISGPAVVLFGLNQGWDRRQIRANLIGYFLVLHTAILLVLGRANVVDGQVLETGLWILPGMLLGYWGGVRLKDRVSQEQFRRLVLVMVIAGGVMVVVKHI